MRAFVVLLSLAAVVPAHADDDAKPKKTSSKKKDDKAKDKDKPKPADTKEPRKPGPHDAEATAALAKIVAATDADGREKAIAALQKLVTEKPDTIDAIAEWLARTHDSSLDDRRKVLTAIKAQIPDKNGRWPQRERSAKEIKADDELDWQKQLLGLDQGMAGIGEVIADDAGIRAIAQTRDLRAARLILDVAFAPEALVMRDECGRYLRKLEPYSIPALTRDSSAKNEERKRYATFQLERLDRQDPQKALAAATGDELLQVAILDAFRELKLREAVHAVWSYVDANAPRVRVAARAAWMEYITGPEPPPAPRARLQLTGGKRSKYAKPLWLTYRELADNELRKAANELLKEEYAITEESVDENVKSVKIQPIDLVEVTQRLFKYYDDQRAKKDAAQWQAAKAKADGGDLVGATALLDRLIATNPDRPDRAEMAKVYLRYGKQLEDGQKWNEAASAYSKSQGLDPSPKTLALQHLTAGKAAEAAGKDGGPDYRQAVALDHDLVTAKQEAERVSSGGGKPVWMIYAAVGAGMLAMLLFGAAMIRRRA
jgi:hypothetical protein